MGWRRGRWVLAMVLTTAVVSACASTIDGSPVTAAGVSAPSVATDGSVAGSSLSPSTAAPTSGPPASSSAGPSSAGPSTGGSTGATGDYPTTPLTLPKTASSLDGANLLEAHRIGAYIPVPTLIDPLYSKVAGISTYPIRNPDALSALFPDPAPSVARRAGMITGFTASRSDSSGTGKYGIILAAFEFPSTAASAAALAPMAAATVTSKDKGKTTIPGFPAAVGSYYLGDNVPTLSFFLVQGSMMLYVWISSATLDTARAGAAKMFAALTKSFTGFTPTPPQLIATLPLDPTGLFAHSIPEKGGNHTVYAATYAPAAVHYFSEPAEFLADMKAAHVDQVSIAFGQMYRTGSESLAQTLRDTLNTQNAAEDKNQKPYALPGRPDVKCLQKVLSSGYDCIGAHGRYVYDLPGTSATDIAEVVAAQELMLAGFE